MTYFSYFPRITYQNTTTIDVTRRDVVRNSVLRDPRAYYPYTVREGDRPDSVADAVYRDAQAAWLVYFSIGAIDPYYAWPLDSRTFENYIEDKYGSIEAAQEEITGWRLDWSTFAEETTTQSGYDSLPEELKKYYTAQYGIGNNVLGWSRRRQDWETSTNMVVTWDVDAGGFTPNERVQLKLGSIVEANAVVSFSNTSKLVVVHVAGDVTVSNTTVVGLTSNTVANVSNFHYTSNNIPINERTYWVPVTAWDREVEANEARKHVNLIDPKYKNDITNQLRKDMQS